MHHLTTDEVEEVHMRVIEQLSLSGGRSFGSHLCLPERIASEHVVLVGGPGAGKGTVSRYLCGRFALRHLSTGDLLRREIDLSTQLGRYVAPFLARGELVADHIIFDQVDAQLDALPERSGFIFDGVPRTWEQAVWLDRQLTARRSTIACAVHIEVPHDELITRAAERRVCSSVECQRSYGARSTAPLVPGICDDCRSVLVQRADDHPDVVRRRLRDSASIEHVIAEYYARTGRLVRVNAAGLSMHELKLTVSGLLPAGMLVAVA